MSITIWNVDCSPTSGMNCFGRLSREAGHTRVPEPPHMMTGRIFMDTLSVVRTYAALVASLDRSRRVSGDLHGENLCNL